VKKRVVFKVKCIEVELGYVMKGTELFCVIIKECCSNRGL